jgi:hypothetical protein
LVQARIEDKFLRVDRLLQQVESSRQPYDSQILGWLQAELFELAPLVAACPERSLDFVRMHHAIRSAVKRHSREWDLAQRPALDRLYELLYGARAAVEEVLLQDSEGRVPPLVEATPEPSGTPSARVLGMVVHSGDLLLSRGTAPTSALIARGSDYPGNFSHVALVHVSEETSIASIIESHIESGVVVSTLRDYLEDRKVRVMLLRPRADLPTMLEDPTLPHRAASYALERANGPHIPYDFPMDSGDPRCLYCSEVAYDAYRQVGMELWAVHGTVSSPGVARWLAAFGVRNMTPMAPSMLEYDPQLSVVAEWRDPDGLWKDHLDNAILDALLEGAEKGLALRYSQARLPLARLAKGWSLLMNALGRTGPVPEGMSATVALKNVWFTGLHETLVGRLETSAKTFQDEEGYRAPYWVLVAMAREALASMEL